MTAELLNRIAQDIPGGFTHTLPGTLSTSLAISYDIPHGLPFITTFNAHCNQVFI